MSHLYRIFSQEVTRYCADSAMPDCNKNLLITGLKNLANINDDKLDEMDPYQRGAKDIIWHAMVGNGRQMASRLGQHSFHATDADPLAVGDNELPQETAASHDYVHPSEHSGPYLMGPMVIRVYPDGRPVPSDAQRPLPKDEDIEDIRHDVRIPLIGELEVPRKSPKDAYKPTREMLPPREVEQRAFFGPYQRYGTGPRFYTRLARPGGGNSLLVRERIY
ncbi:PREDICTED: rhythmically expressed gene 5 protein [Ceratosolen solmsi marchali]|uniref:Rhythmically expressed gene 5 protein n=1 Tax=Ceratosolen solmsi marchali TaxID=326594 RepID=A0AAJ6YM83_9HYME|nr:PREDICTED: rhythmically expressed gene 5 protein [Ceratosolen solmsi marchali]